MPRAALCLVPILLLATPAFAEYVPGFTLYGHSGAERIVEVEVGDGGRARVVSVLRGEAREGEVLALDPELLKTFRPKASSRAILFLVPGPVFDQAGVAWIAEGRVRILPDNWGWGICHLLEYREPLARVFRRAVATAVADRREVARIAAAPPGVDRALAAGRLLEKARPEMSWYVFEGNSLGTMLGRGTEPCTWERGTWLDELRTALSDALGELTDAEAGALLGRIAVQRPGAVRRAHVELVTGSQAAVGACELLLRCHASARDVEEKVSTARALLRASPERAIALLSAEATAREPERARRLLDVLLHGAEAKVVSRETVLDLAARLGRELLSGSPPPDDLDSSNLGYLVCGTLHWWKRADDLPVLLAMARSPHSFRVQALSNLRDLAGKGWKADDPRWDGLVEKLAGK